MNALAALAQPFLGRPWAILLVAVVLLVLLFTPEANIRVDWLLIWPPLLLITVFSLTTAGLSAFRHR